MFTIYTSVQAVWLAPPPLEGSVRAAVEGRRALTVMHVGSDLQKGLSDLC